MKTYCRYLVFSLFTVLFLCCGVGRAATPMRIDIQRITLERHAGWDVTEIVIAALDEEGTTRTYMGLANYILPSMYDCRPCNMPTSFPTNAFNGFQLNFGQSNHGTFTLLEGESDPVSVPATILRKPATFVRTGTASLKAKFTYQTFDGVMLAYDDDVDLVGSYQAEFAHVPIFDGHRISFRQIVFDLRPAVK